MSIPGCQSPNHKVTGLLLNRDSPCLLNFDHGTRSTSLEDILRTRVPSLFKPFKPVWWLQSGDAQTIYENTIYGRSRPKIQFDRKYIIVPDGGCISVDITPKNIPLDTPVVIVLHGVLGGSHRPYVQSVVSKITRSPEQGGLGYRAMVFNFRGCSETPITSPLVLHPGMTDDLRSVILYATYLYPNAKLYALGFSLGAGLLTNYLGEQGHDTPLIAGVGISNVWDYFSSSTELSNGPLINRIVYNPFLGIKHQAMVAGNHAAFQSQPCSTKILSTRLVTMSRFSDEFVAPLSGADPAQFLYDTSSYKSIGHIRIPVLYFNARDDPLFPAKYLPVQQIKESSHVCMFVTDKGGHLAWMGNKKDQYGEFESWHLPSIVEYFKAMSEVSTHDRVQPSMTPPDATGLIRQKGRPNVGFREVSQAEVARIVERLQAQAVQTAIDSSPDFPKQTVKQTGSLSQSQSQWMKLFSSAYWAIGLRVVRRD